MRSYQVIVSNFAMADLDGMALYVANLYRPDSGHKYVNKILGRLASLSYTADVYPVSRYMVAKDIHPIVIP